MQKALITGVNSQIKGLDLAIARLFSHAGPSQSKQFVCSDWARQTAAIEAGKKPPAIEVGNLEVVTDCCDVRDLAEAFIRRLSDRKVGGSRLTITLSLE